jgi:hypothetical protein
MIELISNRRLAGLLLLLIASLLLQACAQPSASPTSPAMEAYPPAVDTNEEVAPESTVPDAAGAAYPTPLSGIGPGGAYPEPGESGFVDPIIRPELGETMPTPEPELGVVSGTVLDSRTEAAPPEAAVYLGRIVTTDTGMRVVRLDKATDPSAVPEADGRFVFPAVQAGEYGLILVHPDISFIVENPETGYSLIFTVEPGQSIALGTITVTLP